MTATGISFRRLPGVVVWVGVVADSVDHVELLAEDESRRTDLIRVRGGFPRCFITFMPSGMRARMTALDTEDEVLEMIRLTDVVAPAGKLRATSVNPASWPQDASVTGDRWDDFFLYEPPFQLYVLPPDKWPDARLSAAASAPWSLDRGKVITDITFSYLAGSRSIDVVNSNPDEVAFRAAEWEEPAWWFDQQVADGQVRDFGNGSSLTSRSFGWEQSDIKGWNRSSGWRRCVG